MFDLQKTVAEIKEAMQCLTSNSPKDGLTSDSISGLKIAVMGCIVNGPGEMADADYGYVGAGKDRVSLYKGKECVLKNIPQEEAVEQLLKLIESNRK
jgi:(E)-4-hydroxy-3-methylbut-2-enyl-diphosphate synthase